VNSALSRMTGAWPGLDNGDTPPSNGCRPPRPR
jgi:hypothetical protein